MGDVWDELFARAELNLGLSGRVISPPFTSERALLCLRCGEVIDEVAGSGSTPLCVVCRDKERMGLRTPIHPHWAIPGPREEREREAWLAALIRPD